jgi:hypothetical protein
MRRRIPQRMMEQPLAQRNRTLSLKPGKSRQALTISHPNAAGIDIGSASHFVAVRLDRDDEPVREFRSFTADLNALADWLGACGVDTVAMETTGVYWIASFELLESRGFMVLLVNARHVKNVSGRKSDVLDCQWLQQLMSYGLLRGAFRPAEQVCALRALYRQRGTLLRSQACHVQHMQKALTQMNIQLTNVLGDVVGESGQKMLRAIVAGERDGQVLAGLRNVRVRASADEIAKSLHGNWRAEHLFALKQALDASDFVAHSWPSATARSSCNCRPCKFTPRSGQGQEARSRAQCAEVRPARAVVPHVRRGPHAHRRHRRHHRLGREISEIGTDMSRFTTSSTSPPGSACVQAPRSPAAR